MSVAASSSRTSSSLGHLRQRLAALRAARAMVRWGTGFASVVMVLVALLAVAFLVDFGWSLDRWSRAVVLFGVMTGVSWAVHRWLWPLWGSGESLSQVALWVEHQHEIDSDLVAALEFDARDAAVEDNSSRLAREVVRYVASFSANLNVFEGFTWKRVARQAALAGGCLFVAIVMMGVYPAEAMAFWNRLFLGSARYPTDTRIAAVLVNGESFSPFGRNRTIRVIENQPIKVAALVSGALPQSGLVLIHERASRGTGDWPLVRSTSGDENRATADPAVRYEAELPTLADDGHLVVRIGDAESDPIVLERVSLPIVDMEWTVTPPSYARGMSASLPQRGARQFAALQGSRISLQVEGVTKPLKEVRLTLADHPAVSLACANDVGRDLWSVPPGTPLDRLAEPLRYTLDVIDHDGLSPDPAITGEIRLRSDRPPRVAATVISRKVLPTATPRIAWGANDDFGIREVLFVIEVARAKPMESSGADSAAASNAGTSPRQTVTRSVWRPRSATMTESIVRGETSLDLAPFQLEKGDEIRVVVAADDERGDFAPQRGTSEPLVFEVTDRNGILESLLEFDQQSAKQLDAIIERELGIGGKSR